MRRLLRAIGPGLILAAAGIGAGDVVVASVTGISFGTTLLWGIAFTVALKYVLTEALARWQLATGETLVRAWVTRLPRWVSRAFGLYLLVWTFLVGASLSSACGLAAASLFPILPVPVWGALHAILAGSLIALDRYAQFQQVMKALVGLMAVCVLLCAFVASPPIGEVLGGLLIPSLPTAGGAAAFMALLGGIGGSLTVLCYSYLMQEEGWTGEPKLKAVRGDLGLAYVFTGVFGTALMIIAAGVHAKGAAGARIALEIADQLATVAGPVGRWIFLIGFWCTVLTAMLGVWQGVPNVYVDLARRPRRSQSPAQRPSRLAGVHGARPAPAPVAGAAGSDGPHLRHHRRLLHAFSRGVAAVPLEPRGVDGDAAKPAARQHRAGGVLAGVRRGLRARDCRRAMTRHRSRQLTFWSPPTRHPIRPRAARRCTSGTARAA